MVATSATSSRSTSHRGSSHPQSQPADGTQPCTPGQRFHDDVAAACLAAYHALPAKGAKPARRTNSRLEWTILAGLVLSRSDDDVGPPCSPRCCTAEHEHHFLAISIATGLKCLPYDRLPLNGDVLHDTHAEVLARRGARTWLLAKLDQEVHAAQLAPVAATGAAPDVASVDYGLWASIFERSPKTARWRLRHGIGLHWYVSAMPCGDASSQLLAFQQAKQDQEAGVQGTITPEQLLDRFEGIGARHGDTDGSVASLGPATASTPSRGRAAGGGGSATLRTKPGRPDSPPSICMSCSDKLALWAQLGIQGSLASAVLEPIRPHSIIMGDEALRQVLPSEGDQFRRFRAVLLAECKRAISLRLERASDLPSPAVAWTSVAFVDSRESVERRTRAEMARQSTGRSWSECEPVPCAGSILCSPPTAPGTAGLYENLVGGTRMGAPARHRAPRDPLKPSSRSRVCKLDYYREATSILARLRPDLGPAAGRSYLDAKHRLDDGGVRAYRQAKALLVGGRCNDKRDALLESLAAEFVTSRRIPVRHSAAAEVSVECDAAPPQADGLARPDVPPFAAWLVTPSRYEHFDIEGRILGPASS
ncbi:uncharacterized protein PFL1_02655 [Pseudozyma flocculosa PF-1]|uniref:tRNA-specific adenosine deaminase 1 n=2 Tax=Pseudozyma flocculosa TaxID=84751 RepID=A0A5C3EYI8_9BASI|nr:uncharacterized protein PFL1_02655 [Pseudozyma flocculosa PF-1]EPQ29982.1 hypothetical protein PFL1_02655 [Pseudozyma flocculosa PF-1]SPO37298.1 uncharacterized protein PSFLO_02771 [Pseudozyma flocculosa]